MIVNRLFKDFTAWKFITVFSYISYFVNCFDLEN